MLYWKPRFKHFVGSAEERTSREPSVGRRSTCLYNKIPGTLSVVRGNLENHWTHHHVSYTNRKPFIQRVAYAYFYCDPNLTSGQNQRSKFNYRVHFQTVSPMPKQMSPRDSSYNVALENYICKTRSLHLGSNLMVEVYL